LIVVVAGLIRIVNLADPPGQVFDEVYYATDSCDYIGIDRTLCDLSEDAGYSFTEVHPPLGKWLIGTGIKAAGYDSFGWRLVPVIGGTITVGLLFAIGRKLFRSLIPAAIASLLLAFDFLHFVQSRIAMLDIFVPMFGLAGLLFLLKDRDRLLKDGPSAGWLAGRPWRAAAGVMGGAATAVKWSGGFFLVLMILLAIAWEVSARRSGPDHRSFGSALGHTFMRESPTILLWLVVLPVLTYLVTYVGRLDGSVLALPWTDGSWWNNWWDHHGYMLGFHKDLEATHSYQSPSWSWMLLKRPVSYFFCSGSSCDPVAEEGIYREIFAAGSPFVWWPSIPALIFVAVAWVRRRDFRRPEGFILAGFLLTYGPWLLPFSDRSAIFIFYLLPTLPFMFLAIAYTLSKIGDSWEAKAAIGLFMMGTLGVFGFYYPLLAKTSIPEPEWRTRIWIFDNCDKPPGEVVTNTVTVTEGDQTITSASESSDNSDDPPTGWCWI
jgi:dolichyl-phosphate-mannose--protein O-mannosyl transferase